MKFVELLEAYQATLWNYQNPSGNLKSMFFLKEQFEQARQALADYVDRLESMASRGDTSYSIHDQLIGGAK